MRIGPCELESQVGAGPDGATFRGRLADDRTVEVRTIGPALRDPVRRERVSSRLERIRELEHRGVLHLVDLDLEADPPWLLLEPAPTRPVDPDDLPLPREEVLPLGAALASSLLALHRLGIVHGGLRPGALLFGETEHPLLDPTGLGTGATGVLPEGLARLDASCRPPEEAPGGLDDPATDAWGLGATLTCLLTGEPVPGNGPGLPSPADDEELAAFLRRLLAPDPVDRPSLPEALVGLRGIEGDTTQIDEVHPPEEDAGPAAGEDGEELPERVGRFVVRDRLGQGGMGAVLRAEDPSDGRPVAVKVLAPELVADDEARRRFHKEARVLGAIDHPNVARLLEFRSSGPLPHLVQELAPGEGLDRVIAEEGPLPEETALEVIRDVARGLACAHERAIIHRDVKPANILLESIADPVVDPSAPTVRTEVPGAGGYRVRLVDFGLAREIDQTGSMAMTQEHTILGTPAYMAPEQLEDAREAGPRSDVYALGATLFEALAGHPPFEASSLLVLIRHHAEEPPPDLTEIRPELAGTTCRIVERALAKDPADRFPDANAFLEAVDRALRGEPTRADLHATLPETDPDRVVTYPFTVELEASPRELWPHVTNTERIHAALGIPPVDYEEQGREEGGVRRKASFRALGLRLVWEEHPFEWIEGRRFGVLREYEKGPMRWFASRVELERRAGGGTRLTQTFRLEPAHLLGRILAFFKIGWQTRRAFRRMYERIDATLAATRDGTLDPDPFEDPARLPAARRHRLEEAVRAVEERTGDPETARAIGRWVAGAPAQEVGRVQPLALARRLDLEEERTVEACLVGAREGLFELRWDIICPTCRISTDLRSTLKAIRSHEHCSACNLDFETDFASSVELVVRAHPDIREADTRTYCVAGPGHSPHVVAQVRVAPDERVDVDLDLGPGAYRVRGPQLPFVHDVEVAPEAGAGRLDLDLDRPPGPDVPVRLRSGGLRLALANPNPFEVLCRVERRTIRRDALTAARASSHALFRELFPGEVLGPGELVTIDTVTLLVTEVAGADRLWTELGDAAAFRLLHAQLRAVADRVAGAEGAVVKTTGAGGAGAVCSFERTADAVRVALDLPGLLASEPDTADLDLRVGVHRGPALVATLDDRLDYFGGTAESADGLPGLAPAGGVVLSRAVAADPEVAGILDDRGLVAAVLDEAELPDPRATPALFVAADDLI